MSSQASAAGLPIRPVVRYPQKAQVGRTYLLTVDLQQEVPNAWDFAEEEQFVTCVIDAHPWFTVSPVDEGAVVLHRFGGTYGPAQFFITARQIGEGCITVTLVNQWSIPFHSFSINRNLEDSPTGAEVERIDQRLLESRWRLRATVDSAVLPLIVDPGCFDGSFFNGSALVKLPADLEKLSRDILPGLEQRHPWVYPQEDWLADALLVMGEPLKAESVKGLRGYRVLPGTNDPRFSLPRILLPLTGDFFQYFSPDDVDRMLNIEVLSEGVAVTLSIPVGMRETAGELIIRKVYREEHIGKGYGPELAIWPPFQHDNWPEYVLFRVDRNVGASDSVELCAYARGEALKPLAAARRTPIISTIAYDRPPEVLELRDTSPGVGEKAGHLGVILPRYRPMAESTSTRWTVGVDWDDSTTTIAIRYNDDAAAEIFGATDLVLCLTDDGVESREFQEAYFFPAQIRPEPFETAVVHLAGLPQLDVRKEAVAVRVNIPFTGKIKNNASNRVSRDLKWSALRETHFLASAFLRQLIAVVLADAIRRGIQPGNVTFHFSYPPTISFDQVQNLENQWTEVLKSFQLSGAEMVAVKRGQDRSRCMLHHFFNSGWLGRRSTGEVILNMGGDTTDIAGYGNRRIIFLDSVLFGGKILSGQQQHAPTASEFNNPFVELLLHWVVDNGLPPEHRTAMQQYLVDGQKHLAFSYLVRTEWFGSGAMSNFIGTEGFQSFQAIILYFFAALFHYVGLSFRALPRLPDGEPQLPGSVMLAGNGSQYFHWLTGLRTGTEGDPFRMTLSQILLRAAGLGDDLSVAVRITSHPGEEVARGLVSTMEFAGVASAPLASGPVVGETMEGWIGNDGRERTVHPTTRLGPTEGFTPDGLRSLRWVQGETEVERFHASLLDAAQQLVPLGGGWTALPERYRKLFDAFPRSATRNATLNKLEYLANQSGGYHGSIFLIGATIVLERMLDEFFPRAPQ
jgi:hypothetical protein